MKPFDILLKIGAGALVLIGLALNQFGTRITGIFIPAK